MTTECNQEVLPFHRTFRRDIVARFDGGDVSSDGGALLLREVDRRLGISDSLADCFIDHRNPLLVEYSVRDLVAQRLYALALGYEDVNDHDDLRRDPVLAVALDRGSDQVAGKSTINRLEVSAARGAIESRYHRIVHDPRKIENLFVDLFLRHHKKAPESIVLDLDATDIPLHGEQEQRFFHGYYDGYCYLPLYIFCGEHVLCAKLRPADCDGASGALEEVQRIVAHIRSRWPKVAIVLRADSGFCRDNIMTWCEANGVDYLFGLARNNRLEQAIAYEMHLAALIHSHTGRGGRVFADLTWRTLDSWSCSRRVVAKAEVLPGKENPRFVVTSLTAEAWEDQALYEDFYCARGEMENRIKEQQLYLFADRTSSHTMAANQMRLWFSALAYCLLHAIRAIALDGTQLARAQASTIRLRLLKIGAVVRLSVRRVWIHLASSYPLQDLFRHALAALTRWLPAPAS